MRTGVVDFSNRRSTESRNHQIFRVGKNQGIIVGPSKRRLRPKLCEPAANRQIFGLAKKIKGIILRPAKQCLRSKLCELAANRQFLASEKMKTSASE
jgi:hypothetical protein